MVSFRKYFPFCSVKQLCKLYNLYCLYYPSPPPGFNIQQSYVLPTQCVLYGSQNKQRLFPCTALTDWFLYQRFNPLKRSGYYMYHQFNIQQSYVLPTQCVLYGSQNKQLLFPCTTLTAWFLYQRFNPLKRSGYYMYHQF